MPHINSPHGNVTETIHEIHEEINKLIGHIPAKANLERQVKFIELLSAIDEVREMSGSKSGDWYLNAVNKLQQIYKEIN